jgi:cytoskeleton protein RodZ
LITPVIEQAQPQGAGAARWGGLREVRERLGWKLPDVAGEGLRIRLPYLEAIERGDLAALPGPAYQAGFVRTYAQAWGWMAMRFCAASARKAAAILAPKAELSFLAPVPDRAVPTGAIVLVGMVLVLAGYGLWYRHSETERRLAEAVPSVPAELAPLALPKPVTPPVAPKPPPQIAPDHVGSVPVGGDAPITVQTMTNTLTTDVAPPSRRSGGPRRPGVDIVRVSCPDEESTRGAEGDRAAGERADRGRHPFPLQARHRGGEGGAACLRINPGNIGSPSGCAT